MFRKTKEGYLSKYQPIINMTDAVIFTLPPPDIAAEPVVIVYHRSNTDEPYFDKWSLPGGMIRADSDANDRAACERIVRDKIGISPVYMEQLQTFSGANRDPRGWSSTVVYFTLMPWEMLENWWAGKPNAKLVPISDSRKNLISLAFDHEEILRVAIERVQSKAHYSTLPCMLLPKHFTIAELHGMYEAIQVKSMNMAAFRRKLESLDFLTKVKGGFKGGAQRPAQLYRMKYREPTLFERGL